MLVQGCIMAGKNFAEEGRDVGGVCGGVA